MTQPKLASPEFKNITTGLRLPISQGYSYDLNTSFVSLMTKTSSSGFRSLGNGLSLYDFFPKSGILEKMLSSSMRAGNFEIGGKSTKSVLWIAGSSIVNRLLERCVQRHVGLEKFQIIGDSNRTIKAILTI